MSIPSTQQLLRDTLPRGVMQISARRERDFPTLRLQPPARDNLCILNYTIPRRGPTLALEF